VQEGKPKAVSRAPVWREANAATAWRAGEVMKRFIFAAAVMFANPVAFGAGHAADLSAFPSTSSSSSSGNFTDSWLAMVSQTQNAQPHWITPLVTVTPRLEQEVRWDFYSQNQGSGAHIDNYGAGKGPEWIPTWNTEISLGPPPFESIRQETGKKAAFVPTDGWGDSGLLLKYRFLSANEQQGNYIVTGFFQMSAPTGMAGFSNNLWIVQPTLALGKGWGDFDIQATLSQQYPVSSIGPPGTLQKFGDPLLANVAFQYHTFTYFWPELEINYEYWPNGTHEGLNQVMLTPGLIIGRIPIFARYNVIVGAGYQIAVTQRPVTTNNLVITTRMTF
jgi:hypothetical protein